MGEQPRTESLFYYFCLEEQIPGDHLLPSIGRYVDFRFDYPVFRLSSMPDAE